MPKKYDITKQSDMKKLEEELKREGLKQAKKAIRQKGIEIECPNCHKTVRIKPGGKCPSCGQLFSSDIHTDR